MIRLIILFADGNALEIISLVMSALALWVSLYQAWIGKKSYTKENQENIHIKYALVANELKINVVNNSKAPVALSVFSVLYGLESRYAQVILSKKPETGIHELTDLSKQLDWHVSLDAIARSARDLQISPQKNRRLFIEIRTNLDKVFNCVIDFPEDFISDNYGEDFLIKQYNIVDHIMGFERQQHFMPPGYGSHFKIK